MKTVNSFLFVGDEIALIDCGEDTDASFEALKAGLKFHDLYIEDIERIILTHAHVDHMGMAQRVAEAADVKVWVSKFVYPWAVDPLGMWNQRKELMIPSLLNYFEPEIRDFVTSGYLSLMGEMHNVWKPIDKERIKTFEPEGHMRINSELWQVLHLPGHSQTQSAFYNPWTKEFISADMLLSITPTPVIEPDMDNPGVRRKGILDMLDSYKKMLTKEIGTVYPGHYEIFENAYEVILRQMERIEERKNECLSIIQRGEYSFYKIFEKMYKGSVHMPAIIMLIGYLDLLESEGHIKIEMTEGFNHILSLQSAE